MRKGRILVLALGLMTLTAEMSWGQAIGGGNQSDNTQEDNSLAASPMTPISGAQVLTPGSSGTTRSFILPTFEWSGYADTNPYGSSSQQSGVFLQSTYTGGITLQRVKQHSQLNLDFSGGAVFYSNQPLGNSGNPAPTYGTFESLSISQTYNWRHWELLMSEQAQYLPESPFGFTGFGGLSSFNSGMGAQSQSSSPTINPSLNPNQSILTGNNRQFSNLTLAQLQYNTSYRSALTFTGSFGTLQSQVPGFIDNRFWSMQAGYNHRLGPRDEVSLTYVHSLYEFSVANQGMLTRGLVLGYGHQVGSRFSIQLSGGPTILDIAKLAGGSVTKLFWSSYDSLNFHSQKADVGLSFSRSAGGGAGALTGTDSELAALTLGRRLGRKYNSNLNFSHSYNESLAQGIGSSDPFKFELWIVGGGMDRQIGHNLSFYVNYSFQRQISSTPQCFSNNCAFSFTRSIGGIGINWHARPFKID